MKNYFRGQMNLGKSSMTNQIVPFQLVYHKQVLHISNVDYDNSYREYSMYHMK